MVRPGSNHLHNRNDWRPPVIPVLVVEDHPLLRLDLCLFLQAKGYECHAAQNGDAAIHCLETHHFDIVIIRHRITVLDSVEFLRVLNASNLYAKPPVILLSNQRQRSFLKKAFSAGAFSVLASPYEPCELLSSVQEASASHVKHLQVMRNHDSSMMSGYPIYY